MYLDSCRNWLDPLTLLPLLFAFLAQGANSRLPYTQSLLPIRSLPKAHVLEQPGKAPDVLLFLPVRIGLNTTRSHSPMYQRLESERLRSLGFAQHPTLGQYGMMIRRQAVPFQ